MAKLKTKPKATASRTHRWKSGSRFPVRPAVAAAALDAIARASAGAVTPAAVVDAARSTRHPLHRCFTWDDTVAAERWREQQARVLIGAVRVIVEDGGKGASQVAFLSVNVRDAGRAYMASTVVLSDDDYREQALAEALAALNGWRRRHRHLNELAEVFEAIDRVQVKRGKAA